MYYIIRHRASGTVGVSSLKLWSSGPLGPLVGGLWWLLVVLWSEVGGLWLIFS